MREINRGSAVAPKQTKKRKKERCRRERNRLRELAAGCFVFPAYTFYPYVSFVLDLDFLVFPTYPLKFSKSSRKNTTKIKNFRKFPLKNYPIFKKIRYNSEQDDIRDYE